MKVVEIDNNIKNTLSVSRKILMNIDIPLFPILSSLYEPWPYMNYL